MTDQIIELITGVTEFEVEEYEAKYGYVVSAYVQGNGHRACAVTTDHAASSYGIPVLVSIVDGAVYGIADATVRMASNIHAYRSAIDAGYKPTPEHIK